ncbi:unnamed protein product [Brassica oleracea var. botrytis]|uniref:DUF4283 domain-containing protein n=1 Tax=Brassica oleracea TaxID=3712 RepID=A0A3P6FWQ4_BRAOL|nr:unnamed protein product [Brassica oleracea]
MGKRKSPKKASPPKIPLGAHVSGSFATGAPPTSGSPNDSKISKEEDASLLITASASTLQDPISEPTFGSGKQNTVDTMNSAKVIQVTNPGKSQTCDEKEGGELSPENPKCGDESHENPSSDKPNLWTGLFKGNPTKLHKKGKSYMLPLGDFIIGQFYSDPPSQGIIQTIVNGIWSKQFRDITVSKMEGFTFLFRNPNASTRAYVLKQCLWQIEDQTMFVAKWEPGIALEHIASQVGDPKFLHPHTAKKTNLEIRRIRASSPWMPLACSFCKEIGQPLKRCKKTPITCKICKSTCHLQADCTRAKGKAGVKQTGNNGPQKTPIDARKIPSATYQSELALTSQKKSKASFTRMELGGTSDPAGIGLTVSNGDRPPDTGNTETSSAELNSSDIDSPHSPLRDDSGFQDVISSRQKKKDRGRGPKIK